MHLKQCLFSIPIEQRYCSLEPDTSYFFVFRIFALTILRQTIPKQNLNTQHPSVTKIHILKVRQDVAHQSFVSYIDGNILSFESFLFVFFVWLVCVRIFFKEKLVNYTNKYPFLNIQIFRIQWPGFLLYYFNYLVIKAIFYFPTFLNICYWFPITAITVLLCSSYIPLNC